MLLTGSSVRAGARTVAGMNLRTFAAAVLTAGLVVPTAPAAASPPASTASPAAVAAARLETRVTIHPYFRHQKYRESFRLSGQVRYRVGGSVYAAQGARVTLLRQPAGSNRWTTIGTDRTNRTDKPTYAFSVVARFNATYQVRFAGNTRLQPARAEGRVWVHRKVPSHTAQRSGGLRLVGQVNPDWRHRRVVLQKRSCRTCSWHAVRRQRTSAESGFNFGLDAPRSGSWFYRVAVPRTTRYAVSHSASYRTFS